MNITIDMNSNKVASRVKGILGKVQFELDSQILKDSNLYCPQAEGFLQDSAINSSDLGSGELVWNAPYAKNQYYNLPNKSKDKNPRASMKWFEVAKSKNRKKWLSLAQKEYDK
ncbi:MAG: minor capsid protein [Spirochaetales bacterium]|nr:minor capsid protein [Spirochaetales bacterium]